MSIFSTRLRKVANFLLLASASMASVARSQLAPLDGGTTAPPLPPRLDGPLFPSLVPAPEGDPNGQFIVLTDAPNGPVDLGDGDDQLEFRLDDPVPPIILSGLSGGNGQDLLRVINSAGRIDTVQAPDFEVIQKLGDGTLKLEGQIAGRSIELQQGGLINNADFSSDFGSGYALLVNSGTNLLNSGSIRAALGVQFAGNGSSTSATNSGLIQSDADFGSPVFLSARNVTLDNLASGKIVATGLASKAISGAGDNFQLHNSGVILADGEGSFGLFLQGLGINIENLAGGVISGNAVGSFMKGDDSMIANAGTIQSNGSAVIVSGARNTVLNQAGGLVRAGDQSTGVGGIGITFENIPATEESNRTTGGAAFSLATFAPNANANMLINEAGARIDAGNGISVLGSSFGEVVTNAGTIIGRMQLGGGDDSVSLTASGMMTGALDTGDGDDLITVDSSHILDGAIFAGAGNDDVFIRDSAQVLQGIDLGDGQDRLAISVTSSNAGAVGPVTGGAGPNDLLTFTNLAGNVNVLNIGAVDPDPNAALPAFGFETASFNGAGTLKLVGGARFSSAFDIFGGTLVNAADISVTDPLSFAFSVNAGSSLVNSRAIRSVLGVRAVSGGQPVSITNNGLIQSDGDAARGMVVAGFGNVIANGANAGIMANGQGATTIMLLGGNNQLDNAGTIAATGNGAASVFSQGNALILNNLAGAQISGVSNGISSLGDDAVITNAGTVSASNIGVSVSGASNRIVNQAGGVITGGDTALGSGGIAVLFTQAEIDEDSRRTSGAADGPQFATFVPNTNAGVLVNEAGARVEALNPDGTAVLGDLASQEVENAGTIIGKVVLGDGDDSFTSTGGVISGNLDTGAAGASLVTDNDLVDLGGTTMMTGNIMTGVGDDSITIRNVAQLSGSIRAGDGNDTVTVQDSAFVSGGIDLGDGDDVLTVSFAASDTLTGAGPLTGIGGAVTGGAGMDTLAFSNAAGTTNSLNVGDIGSTLAQFDFERAGFNGAGTLNLSGAAQFNSTFSVLGGTVANQANVSGASPLFSVGSAASLTNGSGGVISLMAPANGAQPTGAVAANGGGTVSNAGTITALGNLSAGVLISGSGNSLNNQSGGTISASGANSAAVLFSDPAPASGPANSNSLNNMAGGTIKGDTSAGSFAVLGSAAQEMITNAGTIIGTVSLGAGDDGFSLAGAGVLSGNIVAGSGNDMVTIDGSGRVNGTIDLGDGDDVLTVNLSGSDPMAGIGGAVTAGAGVDTLAFSNDAGVTNTLNIGDIGTVAADFGFEQSGFNGLGTLNLAGSGKLSGTFAVLGGTLNNLANATIGIAGASAFDVGGGSSAVKFTNAAIGAVTASGDGAVGVLASGNNAAIFNSGKILATGSNAIGVSLQGNGNSLNNSGIIASMGGLAAIQTGGGIISNMAGGEISGTSNAIVAMGAVASEISNAGMISGNIILGVGADVVSNSGRITGNLDLGDGNDSLALSGKIMGNVLGGDGSDTVMFAPGGSISGGLDFGAGNDTFMIGSNALSAIGGAIIGGAGTDKIALDVAGSDRFELLPGRLSEFETFDKTGTGFLNQTGTASFSQVNILGGSYAVNGVQAGDILVAQSATLLGAGRINGNVTVQGTLSPGNSPGVLTVQGGVSFAAGSTFAVDLSPTIADQLKTTGAVTIAGGTLAFSTTGAPMDFRGKTFDLIVSDASVTGDFAQKTGLPAGLKSTTGVVNGNIYRLSFIERTFLETAVDPNEMAIARALDSVKPTTGSELGKQLVSLINNGTSAQVRSALNSLGTVGLLSHQEITLASGRKSVSLGLQRLAERRTSDVCTPREEGDRLMSVSETVCAYGLAFGGNIKVRGIPGISRTSGDLEGVSTGLDAQIGDGVVAGIAFGYTHGTGRGSLGRSSEDSYSGSINFGYTSGMFGLDLTAGYGDGNVDFTRNAALPSGTQSINGRAKSRNLFAGAQAGFAVAAGQGFEVRPFLGLVHVNGRFKAFSERAAQGLGLTVQRQQFESTRAYAGLGLSMTKSDAAFRPYLKALVSTELSNRDRKASAFFTDDPDRTVFTNFARRGDNQSAEIDGGFTARISGHVSLFGEYSATLGKTTDVMTATGGIRIRF